MSSGPVLSLVRLEPRDTPAVPSDPLFPTQYGLDKVGAAAAWDVTTGTGATVVAVLDTGLDFAHPDLAANLWTNPGEIPGNGIDDDGNGFVDDVHGYDFADNDADPSDADGHGTHVAGIVGAVGNNGIGTAGVLWKTRIMAVRVFDAVGDAPNEVVIRGIDYAVANGARVINLSLGGGDFDPAVAAAIGRARAAGRIVVAAAGNSRADLDRTPAYPASYATRFDNVLTVAATNEADGLAFTTNVGARTVALAAPGVSIVSTKLGGGTGSRSGTSMAAPFVAGAAALVWDANPGWTYRQVIDALTSTADAVPALAGITATGGRLNLAQALGASPPVSPPPATVPPPVSPPPVVPPPPAAVPVGFAVGTDPGGTVTVFGPTGAVVRQFAPFGEFVGGVRVASADFDGDGVLDVVAATGPGGPARVVVIAGATGRTLYDAVPFEAGFTGGLNVAVGDITGDGVPDLIVAPDQGGGPRVRVLDGKTFAVVADFFGIDDPNFRGGARVAVGDVTGDGMMDLIVAAGFGGGPRVTVWDGASVRAGRPAAVANFFVFEPELRDGVYVAAGDLNGDGLADVIAGGGPGGAPRVFALSGRDLTTVVANFFAGDVASRDGVRVAAKDLDGDGFADLIVAPGAGAVTAYAGRTVAPAGTPAALFGIDVVDGVFVG